MVYGDIAYKNGLLMSPNSWKKIYYPPLKRICTELKKFGKPIFYHTDGNYLEIINDLIEIGFDAVHPNEAKSGIDVVRLKEKYGKKISFMGNIDAARALSGSKENIKKELEYKISAITGGGYLPGGDDIPASVSPENYDFFIKLLKSYRKES
ncbi:MAG: uroporphyrinogen decarboxylase family protein [Actinobacteria bacterium]|nr:uroporphyrinogen decarboxylase family protein [Actinomycetota bacterium]